MGVNEFLLVNVDASTDVHLSTEEEDVNIISAVFSTRVCGICPQIHIYIYRYIMLYIMLT